MTVNVTDVVKKILSFQEDVKVYLDANTAVENIIPNTSLKDMVVSDIIVSGVSDFIRELSDSFYWETLLISKTSVLSRATIVVVYKNTPLAEIYINNVNSDSLSTVKVRALNNFSIGESETLEEWIFAEDRQTPNINHPEIIKAYSEKPLGTARPNQLDASKIFSK